MTNKSIKNTNKSDFRISIPEYSTDEIIEILKRRKQYQKEVADLAIEEAIKRGIINSEHDLFSKEFNDQSLSSAFKLFPEIKDSRIKRKITKSVVRALLVTGVIPGVWGVLNIIESKLIEGLLLLLLAGIWIICSLLLLRLYKSRLITILFVILASSLFYIVKILIEFRGLVVMDYMIPVILISLIGYGLLYIKILNRE